MNRKKFLKQATSGIVAASFLPLLAFTKDKTHQSASGIYKSVESSSINGEKWIFEFSIDRYFITLFEDKNSTQRQITITGTNSQNEKVKMIYEAISKQEKMEDDKLLHFLTCKLVKDDMEKPAKNLAENSFGNKFVMEIHEGCHAASKDSKSKLSVDFKYGASEEADCFLTSATVFHKGLSDDCRELTVLRNLRDVVMKTNPEYSSLITEYEIIAPKMLININNAPNKNEILESIFENLVLPSVALVESGKNTKAIEYYRDFVTEMKNIYV